MWPRKSQLPLSYLMYGRSTHEILSILRNNHISAASILFSITLPMFHVSHQCNNVYQTHVFKNLFRKLIESDEFVSKLMTVLKADLTIVIVAFISVSLLPSSFIILPKCLKFRTCMRRSLLATILATTCEQLLEITNTSVMEMFTFIPLFVIFSINLFTKTCSFSSESVI